MITLYDERQPTFIEHVMRRSLPYRDAESANQRILELELEVLRLQAALDAVKIREAI